MKQFLKLSVMRVSQPCECNATTFLKMVKILNFIPIKNKKAKYSLMDTKVVVLMDL